MNLLDVIIVIFFISSLFRGKEIGLVRQLCSTAGFFGGLFLGSYLQHFTIRLSDDPTQKSIITILTSLGIALLGFTIGEAVGFWGKHRVQHWSIDKVDNSAGALISGLTFLGVVWLSAAILTALPLVNVQRVIHGSAIITTLNNTLPSAPTVIADFGKLITPNGFPQVFTGREPALPQADQPASLQALQTAINKDRPSVVKLEGRGCGGLVEGSGFVADNGLVITNAHVVAGITNPHVIDANGDHRAIPIWFDPNLDLAILQVDGLAGSPLPIDTKEVPPQTQAAALGYPGGGDFTASSATVLETFTATGRNIYDQGKTDRQVYALASTIIPGNSGGPVITANGSVIGVVFAQSTTYKNTGYALTTQQVKAELTTAKAQNRIVSTGECAD